VRGPVELPYTIFGGGFDGKKKVKNSAVLGGYRGREEVMKKKGPGGQNVRLKRVPSVDHERRSGGAGFGDS